MATAQYDKVLHDALQLTSTEQDDLLTEIWWAPRVPREKIRRLYEGDAKGLLDEELLEDVGFSLYQRCQSILTATEAHDGRAACPRCEQIIVHRHNKEEMLVCATCGWQMTWGTYFKSYRGKQLHGGGAVYAFRAYVERYTHTRTTRDRMLLIDRLLTAFHHDLHQNPVRPAAHNLLEGKRDQVLAFLDELTFGEEAAAKERERYNAWCAKIAQSDSPPLNKAATADE